MDTRSEVLSLGLLKLLEREMVERGLQSGIFADVIGQIQQLTLTGEADQSILIVRDARHLGLWGD